MAGFYSCLRGRNDSDMASGLPDMMANQETTETSEECPGKKKSKFQTFKNFFAKKKRKEAAAPANESVLKSSQSSDNVNAPEVTPAHSEADQDSESKVNMGNKAMSHDSVFVSDSPSSEANDGLASSQDSIHGKVKSLQLQLKQAIRLGSPPSLICVKKGEDAGALSEDDGLPCSPPEISTLHTVLTGSSHRSSNLVQRTSSLSLEGSESEDEQMSLETSSRPVSPLVTLPVDFSQPASPAACLDTSAARHRIAVKHKACTKRKPASREIFEGGKVKVLSGRVPLLVKEERLSTDTTEPSPEEEKEDEQMSETVDGEERKDDAGAPPPSRILPVSQNEDKPVVLEELAKIEAEEQSTEQHLSSSPSSSSSSETELDAEECLSATGPVPDLQQPLQPAVPLTSIQEPASSLEPPAGQCAELLLDSECKAPAEEPSSLLQEVLSSLECPLTSAFVLEPTSVVVEANEANASVESMEEDLATIPGFLSPASKEEEEGHIPLASAPYCSPDPPDEELSKEAECVETEKDEDEYDDYAGESAPVEGFIEEEEQDLSTGGGEERVEEEEEPMMEGEEEEEEAIESKEMEEAMEEEQAAEEEEEEAVEEEEEEKEEEAMMEGLEVEEEDDVKVETASEGLLHPAAAGPSKEEEEEEEQMEDLREELAPGIQECMSSVEPEVAEADPVSADTAKPQSDDSSDSDQDSMERLECTPEPYIQAGRDEPSLAQPREANNEQLAALAPRTEEPATTAAKPSPSIDIRAEQEPSITPNIPEDLGKLPEGPEPSKVRFTIAPAWQRSLSGGASKEPHFTHPVKPEAFEQVTTEVRDLPGKAEPAAPSPDKNQSTAPVSTPRQPPSPDTSTAENPFGVRLRKTSVLLRYSAESPGEPSGTADHVEPVEPPRRPQSGPPSTKPALPRKPDLQDDNTTKLRKTPEPAVGRAPGGTAESPSWISVAKQKQKSFIENAPEESLERKVPLEKDEAHREGPLPALTNLANKEKAKLSGSPVTTSCSLEICKPAAMEKEGKRTLTHSPPAPLGQDEPPWLALAKKKAKAWSEMPQIVQ